MFSLNKIDNSWTLFIDRDGVINHEKENDYIHTKEEFVFYEGAAAAFGIFAQKFRRIIVITNQRGVGKGLTKESDLHLIHEHMRGEIDKVKGRVDAVYYCADLDDAAPRRKPNPAMGLEAAKDFPDINLSKAIMVGNRMSDMAFGRNLGVHTIYLTTTHPHEDLNHTFIDASFPSLHAFANTLAETK